MKIQLKHNNLPGLLLNFRILNNFTQKHMSILLGCTQSQYSLWENGKNKPSQLRIEAINRIIRK